MDQSKRYAGKQIEVLPNDNPKEREDRTGRVRVSNKRTWALVIDGEMWSEYKTQAAAIAAADDLRRDKSLDQSKVIAVDFNRTLVAEGGPDPSKWGAPEPGAKNALTRLKDEGFTICINSVVGDVEALRLWLHDHGVPYDHINESPAQPEGSNPAKINAAAYIDDRAVPYRGNWEATLADLFDSGVLTKRYIKMICKSCGCEECKCDRGPNQGKPGPCPGGGTAESSESEDEGYTDDEGFEWAGEAQKETFDEIQDTIDPDLSTKEGEPLPNGSMTWHLTDTKTGKPAGTMVLDKDGGISVINHPDGIEAGNSTLDRVTGGGADNPTAVGKLVSGTFDKLAGWIKSGVAKADSVMAAIGSIGNKVAYAASDEGLKAGKELVANWLGDKVDRLADKGASLYNGLAHMIDQAAGTARGAAGVVDANVRDGYKETLKGIAKVLGAFSGKSWVKTWGGGGVVLQKNDDKGLGDAWNNMFKPGDLSVRQLGGKWFTMMGESVFEGPFSDPGQAETQARQQAREYEVNYLGRKSQDEDDVLVRKGAQVMAELQRMQPAQLQSFYRRYGDGSSRDHDDMLQELSDNPRISTVLFGVPGKQKSYYPSNWDDDDLKEFAKEVNEWARDGLSEKETKAPDYDSGGGFGSGGKGQRGARFGNKVFIGYVALLMGMPKSQFREMLLEANRKNLVELSRADLVQVMHPDDVRSSEMDSGLAQFHFIRPKAGAPMIVKRIARKDGGGVSKLSTPAHFLRWDDETNSADFIISTEDVDRDGDTLDMDGIVVDEYKLNPVVCLNHATDEDNIAIGVSDDPQSRELMIRKEEVDGQPRLVARCYFNMEDPVGGRVGRAVKNGFMRAASVSFDPVDGEVTKNRWGGNHYRKWKLIEWSVVTVPANAQAVRRVRQLCKALGVKMVSKAISAVTADLARDVLAQLNSGQWPGDQQIQLLADAIGGSGYSNYERQLEHSISHQGGSKLAKAKDVIQTFLRRAAEEGKSLSKSAAFDEGFDARNRGAGKESCPYQTDPEKAEWLEGWESGEVSKAIAKRNGKSVTPSKMRGPGMPAEWRGFSEGNDTDEEGGVTFYKYIDGDGEYIWLGDDGEVQSGSATPPATRWKSNNPKGRKPGKERSKVKRKLYINRAWPKKGIVLKAEGEELDEEMLQYLEDNGVADVTVEEEAPPVEEYAEVVEDKGFLGGNPAGVQLRVMPRGSGYMLVDQDGDESRETFATSMEATAAAPKYGTLKSVAKADSLKVGDRINWHGTKGTITAYRGNDDDLYDAKMDNGATIQVRPADVTVIGKSNGSAGVSKSDDDMAEAVVADEKFDAKMDDDQLDAIMEEQAVPEEKRYKVAKLARKKSYESKSGFKAIDKVIKVLEQEVAEVEQPDVLAAAEKALKILRAAKSKAYPEAEAVAQKAEEMIDAEEKGGQKADEEVAVDTAMEELDVPEEKRWHVKRMAKAILFEKRWSKANPEGVKKRLSKADEDAVTDVVGDLESMAGGQDLPKHLKGTLKGCVDKLNALKRKAVPEAPVTMTSDEEEQLKAATAELKEMRKASNQKFYNLTGQRCSVDHN